MEKDLSKQDSPEVLPSLIKFTAANEVGDFDSGEKPKNFDIHHQQTGFQFFSPPATEIKTAAVQSHSVSISMPSSPMEVHLQSPKRALFRPQDGTIFDNDVANPSTSGTKPAKYHSQPMPAGSALDEAVASGLYPNRPQLPPKIPRIERLKDKRFDSFKTWSGKLERKLSNLRGKRLEVGQDENSTERNVEMETLPVHRYFDALEGPELDTLRPSEKILLPEDKQWPFLLRFPISSFGICLGVGSQVVLWKNLATSPSTKFLHAVRVNFFRGFRFSLAWWAYTFPMTGAATATIKYSIEVPNLVTKSLSLILSTISTLVVISLLVTTILHAFVLRDLFPNDIAIAISDQRPKALHHKWFHRRTGSSDKDIENFLKFSNSDGNDIEASVMPPSCIPEGVDSSCTTEVHCNDSRFYHDL